MRDGNTTKRTRKNSNPVQVARTQKNTHPTKRLLHRSALSSSNLLVAFLSESPDDVDSRLWQLAQQMSRQPFDVNVFRVNLLTKLQRVPYSGSSDLSKNKKTFYDHLHTRHVLSTLLNKNTLREIWGWLLIREIIKTDRDLENRKETVAKYPLRFHSFLMTELSRHERVIRTAIKHYKVDEQVMDRYLSMVNREFLWHRHIHSLSRFPGSREILVRKGLKEDISVQEGIFRFLKARLRRISLPDRFLRRLTQLICAGPEITEINPYRDDALRKSLERHP